jgi:hypothetical protein
MNGMHSGRRVASSWSGCRGRVLENARVFERVLQYGFLDCGEDESDIRCVGGLCEAAQVSNALREVDGVHTEDTG